MPLLKTFAIIFLVYYFFKYTLRLLAPFIIQSFAKKMQQKFNDQFTQQHQNNKNKEGDITIEGNKNNAKSKDHNVGDYVDFEEVEE
jgi:hypothetical protein